MQEIIVFTIAIVALVYLIVKLLGKRKSHNCDKCELTGSNELKEH